MITKMSLFKNQPNSQFNANNDTPNAGGTNGSNGSTGTVGSSPNASLNPNVQNGLGNQGSTNNGIGSNLSSQTGTNPTNSAGSGSTGGNGGLGPNNGMLGKISDKNGKLPTNLHDVARNALMNGVHKKFGSGSGSGGGAGSSGALSKINDTFGRGDKQPGQGGDKIEGMADGLKNGAKKQLLSPKNMLRNGKVGGEGVGAYAGAKMLGNAYDAALGMVKGILNSPLVSTAINVASGVAHGVETVGHAAAAGASMVGHAATSAVATTKTAVTAAAGFVNGVINGALHAAGMTATVSGMSPLIASMVLLTSPVGIGIYAIMNQQYGGGCVGTTDTTATTTTGTAISGGDWTKKGTTAYNNAQSIWNYWKAKGFSGSAISGILGNIAHEGGFTIPDRAEGHLGNDEKTNGISAGVTPAGGAGYSVGGGGLYQFTPFTKYAPLGDKKWLDIKQQGDYVWSSEVKSASWLNKYASESDPKAAAYMWFSVYERGASYNPAKNTSAQQAYSLFGGSSVAVNTSLLGQASATTLANGSVVTDSANASKAASACDTSTATDTSDSADGTGSVSESGVWRPSDVPSDVKRYIHDPAAAGLSYGSANGWFNPGDQCVHFASSYFYAIWGLKDKVMVDTGANETADWAKALGGSPSSTPKSGAIASVPGNTPSEGPSSAGHTFVVEHVLANGNLIIAEQNYNVYSGSRYKADTWNYRVISKDTYTKDKFTFYTPPQGKLNWGSKS